MLDENSKYEFKYGLADDSNLILSDCVFEGDFFEETKNSCIFAIQT